MDSLIADGYTIQRFADLPTPHQLAIVCFMAVEGDAWDGVDLSSLPCDDLKLELTEFLPEFVELYGETMFGSVIVKTKDLQDAVMQDSDIAEEFSNWEDYHSAYLAGGVPKYPEKERWPVIVSSANSETLRDGWHRFHSYVRDGAENIHAVFFLKDHHRAALTTAA